MSSKFVEYCIVILINVGGFSLHIFLIQVLYKDIFMRNGEILYVNVKK